MEAEREEENRDIIKKFILEQFGQGRTGGDSYKHYSYCAAPFDDCTCKNLDEITYETSLIRGGYIDSFSMVVVLMFLEDTFKVKIPEKLATPDSFDTINGMVKLIESVKKHTN
jgi:acyl carrier protein